jgi:hypothetical protein
MFKTTRVTLVVMGIFAGLAGAAGAQDVIMNSAETINEGNFKLALFPTVLLGEDGDDNNTGIAGRFGYGLSSHFDIEGKVAFFDGLKFYGADAELWLVEGRKANASVSVGFHKSDYELGRDTSGIDTALVVSTRAHRSLEVYGALKLAFESVQDSDEDYTLAHVVPGIEYRLGKDLDLLAEVGIAVNDNSRNYVSVGLAFYLR